MSGGQELPTGLEKALQRLDPGKRAEILQLHGLGMAAIADFLATQPPQEAVETRSVREELREALASDTKRIKTAQAGLAEARKAPHGVLEMWGHCGGLVYLTCPVALTPCDAVALLDLLDALDGDRSMTQLVFHDTPPGGECIGGSIGNPGRILGGLWLMPSLVEDGFQGPLEDYLFGRTQFFIRPTPT